MAFHDTPLSFAALRGALRPGHAANRAVCAVLAWNDSRQTRSQLAKLTARELADIGLERCDIDAVASSHRYYG